LLTVGNDTLGVLGSHTLFAGSGHKA